MSLKLDIVHRSPKEPYLAHLGNRGEGQILNSHLLQVSAISARLGTKIGMARAGELIGLAHDLGKYSRAFQQYLREQARNEAMQMEPDLSARGSVDHSTAGAQVVWNCLAQTGASQAKRVAEFLSLCIASHHSGLIDCVKPDGSDDLSRRVNKADDRTTVRKHGTTSTRSSARRIQTPSFSHSNKACWRACCSAA